MKDKCKKGFSFKEKCLSQPALDIFTIRHVVIGHIITLLFKPYLNLINILLISFVISFLWEVLENSEFGLRNVKQSPKDSKLNFLFDLSITVIISFISYYLIFEVNIMLIVLEISIILVFSKKVREKFSKN